MNNPYFVTIQKEIQTEVEAKGDTLITTDPEADVQKQIDQINDMISQGISAIFLNPVDSQGITPALVALKNANIPIINYDNEVKDSQYINSFVGSDNVNAGAVDGQDLVKLFPNGGKIIILDDPAANAVNDRITGFKQAINGHNFTVVSEQDAKGDLSTALSVTTDLLQAHPDVVAIMGGNDPTALGALSACKAAKLTKIDIFGVDGSPDSKTQIAAGGQFIATGAQSPINIAKQSVTCAYDILAGTPVNKDYPIKTFLIDKSNVAQYGTTNWQ
jgi:ribose transport system substrate-binding protein